MSNAERGSLLNHLKRRELQLSSDIAAYKQLRANTAAHLEDAERSLEEVKELILELRASLEP